MPSKRYIANAALLILGPPGTIPFEIPILAWENLAPTSQPDSSIRKTQATILIPLQDSSYMNPASGTMFGVAVEPPPLVHHPETSNIGPGAPNP